MGQPGVFRSNKCSMRPSDAALTEETDGRAERRDQKTRTEREMLDVPHISSLLPRRPWKGCRGLSRLSGCRTSRKTSGAAIVPSN